MSQSFFDLVVQLKSESLIERTTAIDRLVEMGHGYVPKLNELLTNPNPYVRMGVARALGRINDARSIQPLIDAITLESSRDYSTESESEVLVDNVMALGAIKHPLAYAPLMRLLEYALEQDITLSWYVMDSLERIGNPDAIPRLERLFTHPDDDVRKTSKRVVNTLRRS